jgi:predicted amidophosphoribosyltransferase|tara:strand:+ start:1389 stop:1568 length:180 start_codon:yes stop_codon:yes gene_type:complete
MSNIKNVFNIKDSSKVIEKSVLLVDDVYTTGATADECAKTLLQSGAKHVDVLTLARAIR